jgi:nucleotide-binding universal stress UspA family protein
MSGQRGGDRIVVGVDGSEGSRQALRWACEEAALRGAALEVIHTYELPQDVAHIASAGQAERLFEAAGEAARELVESMTVGIEDVDVRSHAIESTHPAQTLVERSRGAAMLVVSSRGHGSFRSLLLGSVSQQCAHHAECPVVIIRSDQAQPADRE